MIDEHFKQICPGVAVPLPSGNTATVYPMGVRHIRVHATVMTRVWESIARVSASVAVLPRDASDRDITKAIIRQVGPLAMSGLVQVVADCVEVVTKRGEAIPIDSLPAWDLPAVVEAWVMETFGAPEKIGPFVRAMTTLEEHFGSPEMVEAISQVLGSSSPESASGPTTSSAPTPETPTAATP